MTPPAPTDWHIDRLCDSSCYTCSAAGLSLVCGSANVTRNGRPTAKASFINDEHSCRCSCSGKWRRAFPAELESEAIAHGRRSRCVQTTRRVGQITREPFRLEFFNYYAYAGFHSLGDEEHSEPRGGTFKSAGSLCLPIDFSNDGSTLRIERDPDDLENQRVSKMGLSCLCQH